ncbi:hypothetical protein [Aquamicrobium sp. LC103]|uniref:hypothetical protein n=1 Tax=Aquamicrobium sp. LC103 TaxID=1120658 RepID=UPI00063E7B03|nr:hypothetical protein [Aquamicrobium sp. LC103]TKT74122.1 hypothetical protein XW59_024180 [Aquamicrobium sp. LC103]
MGRRWLAAILLAVFLNGCSTHESGVSILMDGIYSDASRVAARTTARVDPHTGWTQVDGPGVVFYDTNYDPLRSHRYKLRSWLDPRNPDLHNSFQLLIEGDFPKRVYLKQAYSKGEKLKTQFLDAERVCGGGCITYERVGIPFDEAAMEAYAREGLVLEILGRRASLTVRVPAGYFEGFLAVHRRHRAG